MEEILRLVEQTDKPNWIVTANPEILLEARRNPSYVKTIQQADLRVVDGFGLAGLLRIIGERVHRVTGADLAEQLIRMAATHHWRVGFFGGKPDVSKKAAETMQKKFSVDILAEEGGKISRDGTEDAESESALSRLVLFAPQILLIGLGHPKQEQWILRHLSDFPALRAVIGVGGTFDFWSGSIARAPKWMRSIGFEWLWRVLQEPRRILRILNALIVFPVFFIADLFSFKTKE
ncbi:MAG TPA: WecB/TagA/CpsF family glycosyltransferase [Patescibacteria group bacterium]|nr:WecB/TagA/CpsF family glycosyltransferase [Patescibacteria group bacterium]